MTEFRGADLNNVGTSQSVQDSGPDTDDAEVVLEVELHDLVGQIVRLCVCQWSKGRWEWRFMIMIMITRGRADQQRGLCGVVWGRVPPHLNYY